MSAADHPLLTVVTVTLDAARHLEACLASVRDQAGPGVEHIVVDGGSTDGTVGILERWSPCLAAWVSEPDAGIADAFNKGLARARGDLVAFLNADDAYAPGALAAVAAAHRTRPDAVIYGDAEWVDAGRAVRRRPPARRFGLGPYFRVDTPVFHPACFAPRAALEQVGGFDPTLRYAMDYDLLLRLHRAGWRFHYVPEVLARYRAGGAAVTHPREAWDEVYRAQRRAGLHPAVCGAAWLAKRTLARAVSLPALKAAVNRVRAPAAVR